MVGRGVPGRVARARAAAVRGRAAGATGRRGRPGCRRWWRRCALRPSPAGASRRRRNAAARSGSGSPVSTSGRIAERVTFEYAVLHVVPRVDRGEVMNAGVLVYSRPRDYLGAAIWLDRDRLRALDPGADVRGHRTRTCRRWPTSATRRPAAVRLAVRSWAGDSVGSRRRAAPSCRPARSTPDLPRTRPPSCSACSRLLVKPVVA